MKAIYFNIDWESILHNVFETVGGGAKDLVAVSNWLKNNLFCKAQHGLRKGCLKSV